MKTTLSLHLLGNSTALVLLTALAAGCATPALWKNTARREWKPNSPDGIALITDTNHQREVVIMFSQSATVGATTECRKVGWSVSQSPEQLALTPHTIGQLTNSCGGELQSIPMFLEGNVPEAASSKPPGYAVWHAVDDQLTVHIDGLPAGPFTLPTTQQKRRTSERIIVLPLSVAVDAAITGAVLFAVGASGMH